MPSRLHLTALALLALISCQGEPQTSYCESLCDWSTDCATAERGYYPGYDEAATREQCLADAQAADEDCAKAAEGVNAASAKLLTECTDAIDAKASAGECDQWTGLITDISLGTTPKECAGQGLDAQATYDAVQRSTTEASADLCDRFSYTFCDKVQTCVLDSLGIGDVSEISDDLITAAGGTPYELCEQEFSSETQACETDDLYAPTEDLLDPNLTREAARDCLNGFAEVSCSQITSGSGLPETCLGAVQDQAVFVNALSGVVGAFTE